MGASYIPVYDVNNPMYVTGSVSIITSGSEAINVTGSVSIAGGATEVTLASLLTTVENRTNTLGQKTSANSTPVVFASDQSTLSVTASSWPLPNGAATESTLSSLFSKFNTLGQKNSAGSVPVVIASDQSSLTVTGSVGITGPVSIQTSSALAVNITGSVQSILDTVTVQGTVTANLGTLGGAALDATLTNGTQFSNVGISKTSAGLSSAIINFNTSGDNTIITGIPANTIRIFKIFLMANGVTELTVKDGTTALTGPMLLTNGSLTLDLDSEPWFVTSAGEHFVLGSSQNVQISGRVYFTQS